MEPTQPEPLQSSRPQSGTSSPPALGGGPEVREVLFRAAALMLVIVIGIIGLVWLGSILMHSDGRTPLSTEPVPPTPFPPTLGGTGLVPATSPAPIETIDHLPRNSEVFIIVQPKDLTGRFTIRFDGGPGKAMTKEISVRLTRSDGTVITDTMNLQSEFPEITLSGSKGTDRIEVFVLLLSGKKYKVIDEPVAYRLQI